MPELRLVPVEFLIPPLKPMREDSLYEGMEDLKESLATHGLQQAIGVVELPTGEYRIIWGMRRSIAIRELGWKDVEAKVFQPDEIDESMAMAHENFHRTQLDTLEEARFYARIIEENNLSITECARRCRRSPATVSRALSLLEGHEEVREALRLGRINAAQAVEINRSTSKGWVAQALRYAGGNGISAAALARWRDQTDASGQGANLDAILIEAKNNPAVDYRLNTKCVIHGDWVPTESMSIRWCCEDCWTKLMMAAEHFVSCQWSGVAPEPAPQPKPITEMSREELMELISQQEKKLSEVMP